MCGAEELQDDMSLKQVYLMNWSPRVSKKKGYHYLKKTYPSCILSVKLYYCTSPMLFGTCIHLPQFRVSDMLL